MIPGSAPEGTQVPDLATLADMQDTRRAAGNVVECLRSLGYRTDVSLLRMSGSTVIDRGDHVVISTRENPGFWWGNFLLLRDRVSATEASGWLARFETELPWAKHRAFGLDAPDAPADSLSSLAAIGLQVERNTVMTATNVLPSGHPPPDAVIRPLLGDSDWAQHLDLGVLTHHEAGDVTARSFAHARAAAYRRAVEARSGVWVGAFVDGRLVSQLGLLVAGRGIGRYQDVGTHPDFRRQGMAGALIRFAANIVLPSADVTNLVMVADPDDEAISVYRSLGFTASEHQLGAFLPPP